MCIDCMKSQAPQDIFVILVLSFLITTAGTLSWAQHFTDASLLHTVAPADTQGLLKVGIAVWSPASEAKVTQEDRIQSRAGAGD